MKNTQGIGSASKPGRSGKGPNGGRSDTVTTANPGSAARGSAGKAVQATKVARIDSDPATVSIGKTARIGKTKQGARVSSIADADLKQLIRQEAYFRSERRGFAAGFEWQDWFDAEQEVYRLLELDLPRH